jgi:hypothetical protein
MYNTSIQHSHYNSVKKVDLPGQEVEVVGVKEVEVEAAVEAIAVQLFSTHFLDMSLS